MKKCLAILATVLISFNIQAQTWEEWTAQKKTQVKYLLEQIVALRVYGGHLKKGYDIVQEGLSTIHRIRQGDYDLHDAFFTALRKVNPKIKNYPKLVSILSLQLSITEECRSMVRWVRESKKLDGDEITYISKVTTQLLEGGTRILDALLLFTTDGSLELSDDERLSRIDALYEEMQDHLLFTRHFGSELKILIVQRMKQVKEVEQSHSLHGTK